MAHKATRIIPQNFVCLDYSACVVWLWHVYSQGPDLVGTIQTSIHDSYNTRSFDKIGPVAKFSWKYLQIWAWIREQMHLLAEQFLKNRAIRFRNLFLWLCIAHVILVPLSNHDKYKHLTGRFLGKYRSPAKKLRWKGVDFRLRFFYYGSLVKAGLAASRQLFF